MSATLAVPAVRLRSEEVDISGLKEIAKRMLPPNSTLRNLILAEPDKMPKDQLLAKMEIFVRLLYQEVN